MAIDPHQSASQRAQYERDVQLITECQGKLYAYVMALVGRVQDAEEIVQRTNLVIWRKLPEFEGRSTFLTWVLGIARREVMAWRKTREDLLFDDAVIEQVAKVTAEELDRPHSELRLLAHCVDQLPEMARQVVAMRYDQRMSAEEIGRHIRQAGGHVRVTLHRIRQALAECMDRTRLEWERPR